LSDAPATPTAQGALVGPAAATPAQPPRAELLPVDEAVRTSLRLDERMQDQKLVISNVRNYLYMRGLDDLDLIRTKEQALEREALLDRIEREEQKLLAFARRQIDVSNHIEEQAPSLSRDVTAANDFAKSWLAYLVFCKHRQTQRLRELEVQMRDLESYAPHGQERSRTGKVLFAADRKEARLQEAKQLHRSIRELGEVIAESKTRRKEAMALHAKSERALDAVPAVASA